MGQKTAKLNGANAVSTAIVKHVLENFDNFLAGEIIGLVHLHTLTSTKIKYFLSHVSILTRDIDIANLSVCLSVRLSVRPLRSGIG